MKITFCGHSDNYYCEDVKRKLYTEIENLIINGADTFFLGGYGNFDILSARTVKVLKEKYPQIKSILIIPYLNKKYDLSLYDESIYPPLEHIPKKIAILKRNEWMVDKCDILISGVKNTWGGAYMTQEYAKRKHKKIISVV